MFGVSTFLAKIADLVTPGSMIATRIPNGANSCAICSLTPSSAHFDATYGAWPIAPIRPATDVTLTIVPEPRSRIWGSTAWAQRVAPHRSTFITSRNSCGRALLDHRVAADAGVVHQVVDATSVAEDPPEAGAHRLVVADVELDEMDLDTGRRGHRVQLVGLGHRTDGAVHRVPGAGEVDGGRPADARVGTGDDGNGSSRHPARLRHLPRGARLPIA